MKIVKKRKLIITINTFRRVVHLSKLGSKFDRKYLCHSKWPFEVFECNTREAVDNIKDVLVANPQYKLVKN